MADVTNVNLLLLSQLNALVKTINEASQSNEKLNSLRNSIMVGDNKIPNKNLKSCIGELLNLKFDRTRSTRKLYGEELNNYLMSKLIISEPQSNFPTYSNRNLKELMFFLRDKVYNLYREKLRKKEVDEPFNVFVKKNLNISPRYALKLRTVGKIWFQYKKLENLSISFDEFYRRKYEILFLMHNHPDIASAWQYINDDFDIDIMDLNN